ncbi:MAG: tripartite tricarboxylate transporter TctB family protein [Desulfobacteraceae bacterium]|nr:MAG: tripartite tricarboxylate transporter TctB family protein [Desulfobacteraceae bacterium]
MKERIRTSPVFTALLLILVAALLIAGRGYPFNVKIAPYAAGIPTLVLLIVILLGELNPAWRISRGRKEGEKAESEGREDSDFTSWGPVLNLLSWVFGFYAAIFFLGFLVATPFFLAGFLHRKAGIRWTAAVSSGVLCTLLSAWFVEKVFKISLWLGAIPKLIPGVLGGSIVPPF